MDRLRLVAAFALLTAAPAAAPVAAQERIGSFSVQEGREALTERTVVAVATPSHEDGPYVSLLWRCTPEADVVLSFLRMQVVGGGAGGPADTIPVHWWFDRGDERRAAWSVASAGQRLVLPEAERSDFTRRAKTSAQLSVRFEGSPDGRPTYTFDLSGAADALERVPCQAP